MRPYWKALAAILGISLVGGCAGLRLTPPTLRLCLPATYARHPAESSSMATLPWRSHFRDPYLQALIDTALAYNQELHILAAEVEIARREAQSRRGEYLPFVRLGLQSEVGKPSAFTPAGVVEQQLAPEPGQSFPEPLSLYGGQVYASWEVDIWRRLRNARQAALPRMMAAEETRRFATTQLVAEVAESYYELLALQALVAVVDTYIQTRLRPSSSPSSINRPAVPPSWP